MTIEVIILGTALIWGGVEVMKHSFPSYYHRTTERLYSEAHERIDVLEQKIAEITGGAK
jgi:hypothetical protein